MGLVLQCRIEVSPSSPLRSADLSAWGEEIASICAGLFSLGEKWMREY
jgi:hypothetical protein